MRSRISLLLLFCVCAISLPTSLSCQDVEQRFKFPNSEIYIKLVRSQKLQYAIMKGSKTLQTVTLDNFKTNNNFVSNGNGSFTLSSTDSNILFELVSRSNQVTHLKVSRNFVARSQQPMDCIDLNIGQTHWFGGPQDRHQYWPVERLKFTNYSYLTKEDHNAGIAERYWLNSRGVFFYVEDQTPLFIEQNSAGYENQLCFSAQTRLPYSSTLKSTTFRYQIGIGSDAKVAHMYAVKNILGIPTGHPDERMVQYPIWSTWALYKAEINDTIVREFGNKILQNNFKNSQLEIDDDWEDCYGALTFRKNKFPNIKQLTDDLKAQGFRVTLWIHPFINKNCTATYNEALQKGYLVLDRNGSPDTQWWNSKAKDAAYIDFSKSEAVNWYLTRLKRLQTEDGIDSFKFDAGESSWVPSDPVLQGPEDFLPSAITRDYIKAVSTFGPLVEVRSGQGTQNLPIFVRMIDKDSEWNWSNGLVTLITTLLQLNMNGYPFVLPDMIGGNGYNNKPPSKELFIRWLQANVFMPSLQFSFVPWNFDDLETISISQKFCDLHSQYTPQIMERFKLATETGEPVNPPLWWVDPEDKVAQGIYDEFLLGDKIIAAPIVEDGGRIRDIYLPKGSWKDGNTNTVYKGPIWIMDYPAPLDVLPYFIRQD
ncbi:myogenesis-regulating glycosidase [Episyrphus balteatus]|uniref:myogenesis-regulating glycosidase n=1 Tax=Episyrphus balteatus TaxID=286459 RepID=UPI0024864A9A|nr:myogenesis-regulating glycosidase [Episyrphus balteatus]